MRSSTNFIWVILCLIKKKSGLWSCFHIYIRVIYSFWWEMLIPHFLYYFSFKTESFCFLDHLKLTRHVEMTLDFWSSCLCVLSSCSRLSLKKHCFLVYTIWGHQSRAEINLKTPSVKGQDERCAPHACLRQCWRLGPWPCTHYMSTLLTETYP